MSNSPDNIQFALVGTYKAPFVGYVSAVDRTVVSPQAMVMGSKNVYKKISGNIAVRPGLKTYGENDTTIAGTKSSFEWETSLAYTRVLRVNNGKLEVQSDIVDGSTLLWYTLQSGVTDALDQYVFDTVWDNTAKKDFLVFVRGEDKLYRWDGGIGKIASTTSNTIVLTDSALTQGFLNPAGDVTVNGNSYAYTGITSDTLTGVTPDPTGEPVDSVVVAKIVTNDNEPADGFVNDFLRVVGNRVHVGSYTSRLVYISASDDYLDYSPPTPRTPGSAEILTLDSLGKGIGVRQGQAHIFGGTSDLYIISYQSITVGTDLTQATTVDKKVLANLDGALRHEFIDNIGDDLIWLSQAQEVKIYGTFRNLNQPVFPTLSEPIKPDLQAEDFTGGALRSVGEFVYILAPNTGRAWLYQTHVTVNELGNVTTERVWHPPFIWSASRVAVIDDVEYVHSNANPMMYQMWDTNQWHDDSPEEEPIPYECVVAMAYRNTGRRYEMLSFNKVWIEGYISPGSELDGAAVMDYQGFSGVQPFVVNSTETPVALFQGNVGVSLGDSSLGDNPIGDGLTDDDIENLAKFRIMATVTAVDVFEYQLRVYSDVVDSRWEIVCIGANHQKNDRISSYITR